ncbi:MAG: hypothetical protein KDA42_15165, partial [Planctomycetales bacterium]|nr:hypothetical protein [Planctomycetales bacterium]
MDLNSTTRERPQARLPRALAPVVAWLLCVVACHAEEAVEYQRDIKPLLLAKCATCHGAVEQEAGLRLD